MKHIEKEKEQSLCLNKLKENNYKGTWLAATGCGKTKLGCDLSNVIYEKFKENSNILIIVPTRNLRDNEWENELHKWGYDKLRPYIDIQCIQTVYKWENKKFSLVICDEVHTQLSDQYQLFFKNNYFEHILGLSATVEDEDKKKLINEYMPIIHETSIQRALDLGLIVPFEIYNISVSLTKDEGSKLRKINYLYGQAERDLGGKFEAFDNASKYRIEAPNSQLKKAANMFWLQMMKRRNLLMNATNKVKATKLIVEKYSNKKILVFCDNITSLENIQKVLPNNTVYHSKLNDDEKRRNLEQFSKNFLPNVLISVKALSAGLNIPKCEVGICVGGSSKKLEDTQRRGRIVRLDANNPNKIGLYFNLYIPNTQEEKWLEKRLENVNEKYIKKLDFTKKFN